MLQNCFLAKVIDHHEVAFIQAGIQNTGQDRFVVRQKLLLFLLRLSILGILTGLRILFLNDFYESADIDIVEFAGGTIDECLSVYNLHGIFADKFELHNYDVILDVLQVDIICFNLLLYFLASKHGINLMLTLTFDKQLVSVVCLLIYFVVIHRISNLHKFRDRAFL